MRIFDRVGNPLPKDGVLEQTNLRGVIVGIEKAKI
jgi:hypothetical protein